MLLRRMTKHVKDQNWFAVALDFFIVVSGILIAFQITNWSQAQGEKANLVRAEIALTGDLIENYINAKERIALSECRKADFRELGERLLQSGDAWEPDPKHSLRDQDLTAFASVVRSPKRYWAYRIWETELARGSFDRMDPYRRAELDRIFTAVRAMGVFQGALTEGESQLKILGQRTELSREERNQLFEALSMLDEQSLALEQIGQNIVDATEALDLSLDETQRAALRDRVTSLNNRAQPVYGECREPITVPFLDDPDVADAP